MTASLLQLGLICVSSMNNNPYLKLSSQKRTIVVGDIHGCFEEFMLLLKEISFSDKDILISVGDFMDRGPGSWETAEFFKETSNAYAVCGNHERRIARVIRGFSQPAWTQKQTLSKVNPSKHLLWAQFFESMPAVIETPHVIVTHARLDPEKSIDNQELYFTAGVGGAKTVIELDECGVPVWYHEFKKKNEILKPVCIGHLSYQRIELVPKLLYALDTGAVSGGFLTAVILPGFKLIQIPSKNYMEKTFNEWKGFQKAAKDIASKTLEEIAELMGKSEFNDSDLETVDNFNCFLEKLEIHKKLFAIKEKLFEIYGEVPPPGKEKGTFFCKIKEENKNLNLFLLRHLINSQEIDLIDIFKICSSMTLQKLQIEISKIHQHIFRKR